MHRLATFVLSAGLLLPAPAWATPVVDVHSVRVLVNCGDGYRSVAEFTEVQPGCMVMAAAETGHGYILYSDCDVEVLPGKVYTVKEDPGPEDVKGFRPICKVASVPWWLVGGAVAGGAVAIAAAADVFDDDDRPRPASP